MANKRILLGWEFGEGYGHIDILKPIADILLEQGFEIFFALKDTLKATAFLEKNGVSLPDNVHVIPAPIWDVVLPDRVGGNIEVSSMADILWSFGFEQDVLLRERLRLWQGILNIVKPDLIIGDYAPTLRIAAHQEVPVCMVGTGFSMLPPNIPIPPLYPWEKTLPYITVQRESLILGTINRLMLECEKEPFDCLGNVMNGDMNYIFSLPFLDAYHPYRTPVEKIFPPFSLAKKETAVKPFKERPSNRGLIYMQGWHDDLVPVLEAASSSELDFIGYIGDQKGENYDRFNSTNLKLSPTPLEFDREIPNARLIIHHGGYLTAAQAALAGVPQVILPQNPAHLIVARALKEHGCAVLPVGGHKSAEELKELFSRLMNSQVHQQNAISFASTIDIKNTESGPQEVARSILGLLK